MLPIKKSYFVIIKTFLFIITTCLNFAYSKSLAEQCHGLNAWMESNEETSDRGDLFTNSQLPLFKKYPQLTNRIPYISLALLPSPILQLESLGRHLNHNQLFLKNDSSIGELFGGNKIRKLCFLLGWALYHNAEVVMTCGGAGSNHSTATIACCKKVHLECKSFLTEQLPTSYTRRNLVLSNLLGGQLHIFDTIEQRQQAIIDEAETLDKKIFYIPGGGSTPRGALGFVNAAFELATQIEINLMPEPDLLFVAAGSNGTAAGLALGLQLAGLKTQVVAVCTTSMSPDRFLSDCKTLFDGMLNLLELPPLEKPQYPKYTAAYFGAGYAALPENTAKHIDLLYSTEKIKLDGTYAGKAFSAFVDTAQSDEYKDKVLLFWNSFCSGSIEELSMPTLPFQFHHYFKSTLQPGDPGVNQ